MKVVPLRLTPAGDLRRALEAWMGEQEEQAGCVISAVGSLSVAQLPIAVAASQEVVIGLLPEWWFSRPRDPASGDPELLVSPQARS